VQLWTRKKPSQNDIESTCEYIRKFTQEPAIKGVQFISHQKAKKKRGKRMGAAVMSLVEEQKQSPPPPISNPETSFIVDSRVPTSASLLNHTPPTRENESVERRDGPLFIEDFPSNYQSSSKTPKIGSRRGSQSNYTYNSNANHTTEVKMNGYPKKNHNNKRAASPLSVNAKPYAPMEPRVYIPSPEPISPKTENISQSFVDDPYVSSTTKYPSSNSLHLGPKSDQSSSDGSVWTARKTENFSTKSKPVPSLSNSSPSPTTSPLNVKSTSIPSPIQNVHGTSSATERSDSKKENKSQISPDKNSILSAKNEKKEPTTRSLSSVSPSNNTFVSTSYSSSSSFSLSYFSSSSSSSLTTSTKVSESENLDETSETTELEEEDEDQEEVTPSEMEEELIVEVSPKKKNQNTRSINQQLHPHLRLQKRQRLRLSRGVFPRQNL